MILSSIIAGGFLGVFGAGLSAIGGLIQRGHQQEEAYSEYIRDAERRAAEIKEAKARAERDIAYAKSQFKIEQENAFRKADDIWHQGDRIDMRADLDETLTGRAFNLAMKQNAAADERLLHQEQRGKQNFQNEQGSMKAALGMSGARAGTNSAEQLLSQNEENFNQDLALMGKVRENEKEVSFIQAFSNLKGGMFRIDEERDAANQAFRDSKQLRDDYSEGGRIVNLFNQQINNRRADLKSYIDLQQLQQKHNTEAYDQRSTNAAKMEFLNVLTDSINGFNYGFQMGSGLGGYADKWGLSKKHKAPPANSILDNTMPMPTYKYSKYHRLYKDPFNHMFSYDSSFLM